MKKSNTFLLLGCLFFLSPGLLKCDEINNFAQALKKIEQEATSAEVFKIIEKNTDLLRLAKNNQGFRDVLDKDLAAILVDSDCVNCVKYLNVEKNRKDFIDFIKNIKLVDDKIDSEEFAKKIKELVEQKEPTKKDLEEKLKKAIEELKNTAKARFGDLFNESDLDDLLDQAAAHDSYDEDLMKNAVAKAAGVESEKLTADQFVLVLFEWADKALYDSLKQNPDFLNDLANKPEVISAILRADEDSKHILKNVKKSKLDDAVKSIELVKWDNSNIDQMIKDYFTD